MCVCVCVCVCERERERERESVYCHAVILVRRYFLFDCGVVGVCVCVCVCVCVVNLTVHPTELDLFLVQTPGTQTPPDLFKTALQHFSGELSGNYPLTLPPPPPPPLPPPPHTPVGAGI